MVTVTGRSRASALVVGLVLATGGIAPPAAASTPQGRVAAALVTENSYRHFLDEELYTHAGDDRGYGPEHDLARDNIAAILEGYGLTVELEGFYCAYNCPTNIEYFNVVATKLGTTHPDQEYIVSAHYDSVSNPGADDNASGVALVLEAARILSGYDSEYTIRFVAFDREEQGLHGAKGYVQDHIGDDIIGVVNADMVSYNIGTNSVDIHARDVSLGLQADLVTAVAEYGEGLGANAAGGSNGSDHAPFESEDIPAVLLIEDWGNPFYHQAEDNVDVPDYIDYAFAVRVSRSAIGFLAEHAGVDVDLPDADYYGDGDVDEEDFDEYTWCFTGPGVAPTSPCEFFDLDLDGDVDCDDGRLLAAVWTSGDPPTYWRCDLDNAVAATAGEGGRCLTVTPPVHDREMALLLAGDPDDAAVSCLSLYIQPDGGLDTTPVFQTHDAWGTLLICNELIIPETSYSIYVDLGEPGSPVLAPAAKTTTALWGDTVGPMTPEGEWPPPDGSVDIIDVVAILDKFKEEPNAPPLHWVDLVGLGGGGLECAPDQSIDIVDAVGALDAFRGDSFGESVGCLDPCAW